MFISAKISECDFNNITYPTPVMAQLLWQEVPQAAGVRCFGLVLNGLQSIQRWSCYHGMKPPNEWKLWVNTQIFD